MLSHDLAEEVPKAWVAQQPAYLAALRCKTMLNLLIQTALILFPLLQGRDHLAKPLAGLTWAAMKGSQEKLQAPPQCQGRSIPPALLLRSGFSSHLVRLRFAKQEWCRLRLSRHTGAVDILQWCSNQLRLLHIPTKHGINSPFIKWCSLPIIVNVPSGRILWRSLPTDRHLQDTFEHFSKRASPLHAFPQ